MTNALPDGFECPVPHTFCARVPILLGVVIQAFAEGWLCGRSNIYGWWDYYFLLIEQKAGNMGLLLGCSDLGGFQAAVGMVPLYRTPVKCVQRKE